MLSPLVSVVVSAYDRPLFLGHALESVLGQTYRNLEVLVQDDSTSNECGRVALAFGDPRIRYVRNAPSLGTIANLRSGYRRANGEFICTLNDDDMYLPDYIATMVAALEMHPECCLAFADHFIVDDSRAVDEKETDINSQRFGRDKIHTGVVESTLHVALIAKSVPGMFALYRREVMDFDDFPDEVSSGYDYWLTYLATRSQRPIYYVSDRLTSYRVHSASQTSSFANPQQRLKSLSYDLFTTRRLVSDSRLKNIQTDLSQRLAKIHVSFGSTLLRLGQRRAALHAFWEALRIRVTPEVMAGVLLSLAPTAIANRIMDSRRVAARDLR